MAFKGTIKQFEVKIVLAYYKTSKVGVKNLQEFFLLSKTRSCSQRHKNSMLMVLSSEF